MPSGTTPDTAHGHASAVSHPISDPSIEKSQAPGLHGNAVGLGLAALGVVFGDIGTSPLYTFKTVVSIAGSTPTREVVLGSLSLIVWTLVIITSVKYVAIAMRIDNDGEGGILALMSLLGVRKKKRPLIVAAGLFGAALIYGDGAITPAISVLSALEGLELAAPAVKPYILPMAVVILAALFLVQPLGTARIGRAFGPIMAVWFLAIALLGFAALVRNPSVLIALNPYYGLKFLFTSGGAGFLILGAVFLCVTGAEALYADMGHFGPHPIRMAWSFIVFPSLLLSYFGQAAYILSAGVVDENVFYRLCPSALIVPMVILATLATVIASQALVTGAFSMTRQAIRLGWMQRMHVTQTSGEGYGQIYVGAVNWLLMIVTIALALMFKTSESLASAYGVAVAATMLMTTVLLYIAMIEVWRWPPERALAVAGFFFVVDAAFFAANLAKIAEGGYVPLVLAAVVYASMYIWHRGTDAVRTATEALSVPLEAFLRDLSTRGIVRAPGTAVFFTRFKDATPPVMAWYVDHAHSLQKTVIAITVETAIVPWIEHVERAEVSQLAPDFWRVLARYGFMEKPDVLRLLKQRPEFATIDFANATYFIGHETIEARADGRGLPRWIVWPFAWLQRNASHVADTFNFPRDRVIEIGRRVEL
ncbi:MAG: potassium transporter Kup [Hyphomicrobiales bacterium]|nr:MAG: potassium transporter Kup [Hyphomicrobiales bacterium]